MQLDPSESINNMGTLRVDVLDGADLPSADRNGYSDPFCKFELNGETVFKTQVQKKTLHPAWNEFFETEIPSRTAAHFKCKVYDWDFASDADFLGAADISLALLDPFRPQEMKLTLDGKSGSIRIRCLFKPSYITRSKVGTGTFSGTFAVPGKIVTGVAGAPIKGVGLAAGGIGAGASFVGSNVGKGAKFITSGFRSKKDKKDSVPTINAEDVAAANGSAPDAGLTPGFAMTGTDGRPTTANGQDAPFGNSLNVSHSRNKSNGNASIYSNSGNAPTGIAHFTIVAAEGYPSNANVQVYVKQLPKEKTIFKSKHLKSSTGQVKFDESFDAKCTADTQFQIVVKDRSTFGSDDILGTGLCFVDESGRGEEKMVKVGPGAVFVKSIFQLKEEGMLQPGSPSSQRTVSGGMRRSFLSKRNVSGAENGRLSYSRDGTQ